MQKITLTATAAALLGLVATGAHAATYTYAATSNGVVNGDSGGVLEVNTNPTVEGASDPNDAQTYQGYVLYDYTGAGVKISSPSNLTLNFTSDTPSYDDNGLLDFYLVGNTANIANPSLSLDTTVTSGTGATPAPATVSAASQALLNPLFLGSVNFVPPTARYAVQTFNLSIPSSVAGAFDAEAAAGNIGVLMTFDTSTPAGGDYIYSATTTSSSVPVPSASLSFNATPAAVPESSSLFLAGLGLAPLALIVRKRRAAK